MITRENLKHLSKLSKIHLSEDQYENYAKQIEKIVKYLDKLDEISLDQTESYFTTKEIADLRDDEAKEFHNEIINMLKTKKNRFVKGPRMN
ncbi:MAG: Asp-tRNA(Asn)/Glu-tRNA(Gln) amidotransferase subunit GatC [Nitrososphaeraceae archaeon]|nr:Asp-tRNA(Asn)/Glu-tRNA(Gln) amidotransferase subunit GatC [Nitrososphaeraceae archaeon]